MLAISVKRKTENGKRNRRTKQEQRLLADYALQEGGKACKAGLKRKTKNGKRKIIFPIFKIGDGGENFVRYAVAKSAAY